MSIRPVRGTVMQAMEEIDVDSVTVVARGVILLCVEK